MYPVIPSDTFLKQAIGLSSDAKAVVEKKLRLASDDPGRFKSLYHPGLTLFSIKFNDKNKDKRLIYTIENGTVKVLFILDRDKGYADLEHWLRTVGH